MKTNCINYGDCRLPVQTCNDSCKLLDKTCWDCAQRIGEECGLFGHEVYFDSMPCDRFEDDES